MECMYERECSDRRSEGASLKFHLDTLLKLCQIYKCSVKYDFKGIIWLHGEMMMVMMSRRRRKMDVEGGVLGRRV